MKTKITYHPIGIIRTPFKELQGMPIQPSGAKGVKGQVEIEADFAGGLQDIEGFSHIILLYHLHKAEGYSLLVVPFLDKRERGLFATRAPRRPNPIGLSVVRLVKREGNVLHVEDVDILDGTPLLDIKPYVPTFDPPADRLGWLEELGRDARRIRSDDRFA